MVSDVVFFFSSRRRHTRCSRDWSSDVCSSDLRHGIVIAGAEAAAHGGIATRARLLIARSRAVREGLWIKTLESACNCCLADVARAAGGRIKRYRVGSRVVMNDAPIHAELQRVLPLDPVHVVQEIVHRNVEKGAAVFRSQRAQSREVGIGCGSGTRDIQSLPDIAVTEVVNQVLSDGPQMARG